MSNNNETLRNSINDVEAGYEYMLAYAAQGLIDEPTSGGSGPSIRVYLEKMQNGLVSIVDDFETVIKDATGDNAELYLNYLSVLKEDAAKSKKAVDLVMSLPSIGSQVIDNLNASIHLRAILTDIFLIDEALTSLSRHQ
ncbi:hypothetical protein N9D02_07415 [Emcibacteraceae bacterium]|nr:hypothetical protein [Emcibacteraceae bacterium]